MKTRIRLPRLTVALGLCAALVLAACDGVTAPDQAEELASDDLAEVSGVLTQELGLSTGQQQGLNDTMNRHQERRHEPGFLWYVAAELQATLTDEQKARLFERAAQWAEEHREGGPAFGPENDHRPGAGGPRPGGPAHRPGDAPGGGLFGDLLTEEQRAQIEEIREGYRPEFEALIEAHRNGEIDDEAFFEQMQALHEALKAAINDILTDEQRAIIEERLAEREAEMEARREQERAVMIEVLGLTDEQAAALEALREEMQAEREALVEQLRNDEIDRDAFHEALATLREEADAQVQTILDATQYEIFRIYHALKVLPRKQNGRGGPGGGPGGPGGGPGGGHSGGHGNG